MASFDISVDDFLTAANAGEIKEIIVALVEDGYLPSWVIRPDGKIIKETDTVRTPLEEEYREKMDLLKNKYYSLSSEEEDSLKKLFSKYL